ncbi:hypothetical protein P22_1970 [Propionispora sp. 2/2-37]|nr:hypothetical protein P22_1970 [Propionispora sp. 2/2-37]
MPELSQRGDYMKWFDALLGVLGLVKKADEVKKTKDSTGKIVGAVEIIQEADQLRKNLKK